MKKKIIILSITCLIIVLGVIGFIYWDNMTVSTITLDINPSIEINLNRRDKVKSVIALNEDAKKIVNNDLEGKTLDDAFDSIVEKLIEEDYVYPNDLLDVVLYSKGSISNQEISNKISTTLGNKNIPVNIITIDDYSKEDKELAKEYNVSPAKVAYIKTIIEDKKNIELNSLANKSVSEIKETKETGKYCDEGWTLDGDWCLKEKERIEASPGEICPQEYHEVNGICYHDVPGEDSNELVCPEGFTLKDSKCVSHEEFDAEPVYTCSTGELVTDPVGLKRGIEPPICVDKSTGIPPTQRCLTINHTMVGGKCADGPKPTINGGCEPGDYLIGGGCYTLDNEDQWVCTDGNIYERSKGTYQELCPETFTYIEPTISTYNCPDGFNIKEDKCYREDTIDPFHKKICPTGYSLLDDGRCINYNKTANKENGFVCNMENSKPKGEICIIYDRVEAKQDK